MIYRLVLFCPTNIPKSKDLEFTVLEGSEKPANIHSEQAGSSEIFDIEINQLSKEVLIYLSIT